MNILPLLLSLIVSQSTTTPSLDVRAGMFLGARVSKVQRSLPLVRQVVLVPDEATYLDEISKWSTESRWPVLFEQEPFASQFIRSFKPEKVWRREAVGKSIQDKEQAMVRAVASAWNGSGSIENAFAVLKLPPSGIVFTNANDPARAGAVALAAGRGQLLKFISADWGESQTILSASLTTKLQQEIDKELQSTGLKYAKIGDTIDAITLCQTLPSRVTFHSAVENPVAITDVIGRNESGARFAWTGWSFGSKAQSTYMAMSSLFLERDQYWFCNTYPNKTGWSKYGLGNIPETLPKYGIEAEVVQGSTTDLRRAEIGGVCADVMYFTTKGNADFLEMSDERIAPTWLPILDKPTALYFLHSWSLKNPGGRSTVGGVWLSRGVYAYIGSSHEPMLSAFVPPSEMLKRTMSLVPFLVSARWNVGENPYARSWRVNTIGDPLMLCPPKGVVVRVVLPAVLDSDYVDVETTAKQETQQTKKNPCDQTYAAAIQTAILLGQDSTAQELWKESAKQGSLGPETARSIMPALFRLQDNDGFLRAFALVKKPKNIERDMLWQLVSSRVDAPLQVLVDNLREPYPFDDLLVIRNRVERNLGNNVMIRIIQDKLKKANGRNKRELQRLLKEYND
tara:strand:+ start:1246 stop:3117 length:1872 start_codon:yes stop_codon:yes gene_type:complete